MSVFIPNAIGRLPHWARVAFAARCAKRVQHLFSGYWKEADQEHHEALQTAVQLAENSAANGQPVEGLRKAAINATGAGGAALMKTLGYPAEFHGNAPDDEHAALVVSFSAKAAEWAAEAAQRPPGKSEESSLEAYIFARDAAHAAEDSAALASLQKDFEALLRAAKRGHWKDETPVPPCVFDLLSEEAEIRPWWKLW